ncbi:MAG: hypothetical protein ACRC68_05905 [Clostridium sp.]
MEDWVSISDAAKILNITDKALYKRISNQSSSEDKVKKINGKTCVNEVYLEQLKSVVRKRADSTSNVISINAKSAVSENNKVDNELEVYSNEEFNLIKSLKSEVEFLRLQLERQQNSNENKEKIILNMQEIVKSEQCSSRKLIDYEDRSRELDNKLFQLRQDMVEKSASKRSKGLFSFFR